MHIIVRYDYHDSVIHYIIPLAIIMCLQTNSLTKRFNQTLSLSCEGGQRGPL